MSGMNEALKRAVAQEDVPFVEERFMATYADKNGRSTPASVGSEAQILRIGDATLLTATCRDRHDALAPSAGPHGRARHAANLNPLSHRS